MFRKDSFVLGTLIAIIVPVLFHGIVLLLNYGLVRAGITDHFMKKHHQILLGISGNLLPLRYFFVNLKHDRTGRAILFVTFVLIFAFFIALRHLKAL